VRNFDLGGAWTIPFSNRQLGSLFAQFVEETKMKNRDAIMMRFPISRARGLNNRRGSAFLTAMFFLVILLGLGTVFVKTSIEEVQRASRIRKETRALNLAEAGLDYTAWRIYNANPTSYPVTYARSGLPEGEFSAEVRQHYDASGAAVPNSLDIVSTGKSQGWQCIVKAVGQYLTPTTTNNAVFDSALYSETQITLKGTTDITGDIHSNGNISVSGSAKVVGNASAGGTSISDQHGGITGSKTTLAPKVHIPTVDLQHYRSDPKVHFFSSGINFNSSNMTNLDGIYFVDGDMNITGQLSGKAVFVATGTIRVAGGVTLAAGTDSAFALISTLKIKITGGSDIQGVVYAHNADFNGNIDGLGNANVTGSVVADNIGSGGTANIVYKHSDLDLPGSSSSPIQVNVVSWRRVK
jgi:cytoskeletal protein CcmA (bactofilin family)